MSKIAVFGAGGKFGRIFLAEARDRGEEVTAVVRDTAKYADLVGEDVALVAGDAADADSVATVAGGHDVAVCAVYSTVPEYLVQVITALREATTAVDWLYVSPAAYFDAAGPRTGTYRVGGDMLRTGPRGVSHVSYADFAVALVDEIRTPMHHNGRISIID